MRPLDMKGNIKWKHSVEEYSFKTLGLRKGLLKQFYIEETTDREKIVLIKCLISNMKEITENINIRWRDRERANEIASVVLDEVIKKENLMELLEERRMV